MITVLDTVHKFVTHYGKCTFQDEQSSITLSIKNGELIGTLVRKSNDDQIIRDFSNGSDNSDHPEFDEVLVRVYTMVNPNFHRYRLI